MNLKNLKIGTQIKIGFVAMLSFVIVLGVVSYLQTQQHHQQTETMYKHPLQVRKAISVLEVNIMNMRLGMKDLMLANSDQEKQAAIQLMEVSRVHAQEQFSTLSELYLGSNADIDEAHNFFIMWTTARKENIELALSGEIDKIEENLSMGIIGAYRDQMLASIQIIDKFAENKAESLYISSMELNDTLNKQLFLLLAAILLLAIIINTIFLRNLRKPLKELTDVAQSFHKGDMDARVSFESRNDLGVLSSSFNALAASIQMSMDLNEKSSSLKEVMLSVDDAKEFFRETLNALATHTGSQIAAIYLLSDDKKTFQHFESTGMDDNARQSFEADNFEGEFGAALSTRKLQHIQNISEDTRFVFCSVSGKFVPRAIITIPILSGNEVIAIISLASISKFDEQSINLLNSTMVTMSARIVGILAYRTIKQFKEALEQQNRELDVQKTELTTQTAELTQQNIELEMQKKQLAEASQLKTNFLSNMSHELRTPLNSVIALSGVLNRRLANQIPEEEHSYLEVIERNGKNLLILINDILDISRIEAGREEIEIIKFNANNLISEVVTMLQPLAKQKNIKLTHVENDLDLFITSDVDKCRHVLQNIIGNAVKFTEKGKVEILAKQSDNNITITVIDTGIGIAEKHLSHIFEEFRQADGSTSRRFGGTGLGLAIAKKYANLLGGTISAKSIVNKGTEFTFSLPLHYNAENRIVETEKIADYYHTSKQPQPLLKLNSGTSVKTILLVEDSEPAIIQIKDLMEESGYHILVARDAGEAFEIINQIIPDAMILDLMMPGIDGFDVLKTLREAEPTAHIPVLILTAKHITKEELKSLKQNNIHQLIQKGDVNRIELQNAVTTMLFPYTVEKQNPQREYQTIEGKPVVLVVEDNLDNMISIKAILADNYIVIEAADGNEGIEMAQKYVPNLVLMDIALPGIDGIEAFKGIRKLASLQHIPIIALTASAMSHDRETVLSYGFDGFIPKPINEKDFLQVIHEVLYGR